MKKRTGAALILAALCLALLAAAGSGARAELSPLGTWRDREIIVDGETSIGIGTCSVTFYENGTFIGILFHTYQIGGQWSMEDEFILTDDATMMLEDENTLIIYYGEYVIRCARETPPAEAAVQLMTESFGRIDDLFGRTVKAMEAVRRCISDGRYAPLVSARILCSEVMTLTDESLVPENPFDRFDQQELYGLGIDAASTGILTDMCAGAEGDVRQIAAFCMEYLFTDYCHTDTGGMVQSLTESFETYFRMIGRMQPVLARLIFGPLWEEPDMESFWASVSERWPLPGAELPENTDEESMQNLYFELVDRAEQADAEGGEYWTSCFAVWGERNAAAAAGEYDSVRSAFGMPEAMPVLLMLPDAWFAADRIRIHGEGESAEGSLPAEAVLTVSGTDGEEYAEFMNLLLSAISDEAAPEGNAQDGWRCEVSEPGYAFRSEWNPADRTAVFRYDPSQVSFEAISVVNLLRNLAESAE